MGAVPGLNLRGVSAFCRALLREPQLLLPQLSVADVSEVPFQALKDRGFEGVVFDKDNTLTAPHAREVPARLQASLDECRRVFGRERVLVFSNSAGSRDDADGREARAVEAALDLPVLRHGDKKPGGGADVRAHFGGAGVDLARLVMVGDRFSTDVLFGNLHGMLAVRTRQLSRAGESAGNALLQRVEEAAVRFLQRRGVRATPHPRWPDVQADVDEAGAK